MVTPYRALIEFGRTLSGGQLGASNVGFLRKSALGTACWFPIALTVRLLPEPRDTSGLINGESLKLSSCDDLIGIGPSVYRHIEAVVNGGNGAETRLSADNWTGRTCLLTSFARSSKDVIISCDLIRTMLIFPKARTIVS